MVALRLATHDSGSGWVATPFLCDAFIHDSTPVYPGAHHGLLGDLIEVTKGKVIMLITEGWAERISENPAAPPLDTASRGVATASRRIHTHHCVSSGVTI